MVLHVLPTALLRYEKKSEVFKCRTVFPISDTVGKCRTEKRQKTKASDTKYFVKLKYFKVLQNVDTSVHIQGIQKRVR